MFPNDHDLPYEPPSPYPEYPDEPLEVADSELERLQRHGMAIVLPDGSFRLTEQAESFIENALATPFMSPVVSKLTNDGSMPKVIRLAVLLAVVRAADEVLG